MESYKGVGVVRKVEVDTVAVFFHSKNANGPSRVAVLDARMA